MQRADASARMASAQAAMAEAGLKAMIPFRRPFLDYLLSALADAGCCDVCLVIGPDHDVVRDHYAMRRATTRVRLTFTVQTAPLGTADAVLAAEAFVAGDPFLVMNADNYYPAEVFLALIALDGQGLPAFRRSTLLRLGNIDAARVASFAALDIGPEGTLLDIVEKPDAATLARFGDDFYVSMNCWRFGPEMFEACRRTAPSPRGEMELPDAVRLAIRSMGQRFQAVPIEAGVLDLSRRTDIAEVERRLAHIEPRP
jgi:glucose-1-phosphate thymidylyltransferase